jgi:predicted DNA-binding transcriptional regulator YafY
MEATTMQKELSRFAGKQVEIIYLDRNHRLSQRQIKILSVDSRYVHAYCMVRQAPRVFRNESILAVMPMIRLGGVRQFA